MLRVNRTPSVHRCAGCLLVAMLISGCGSKSPPPAVPPLPATRPFEQVVRQDDVVVTLRLTTPRPTVADLIGLEVVVEAPSGTEVRLPSLPPEVADLFVKSSRDLEPAPAPGDRATWARAWQLEALVPSDYHLPPLEVRYRTAPAAPWRTIRTRELGFEVFSALGAALDPSRVRPNPPPEDLPPPAWATWLSTAAIGGLAGSAAVLGVITCRRWAARRDSASARALQSLTALERRLQTTPWTAESVYTPLVGILRAASGRAGDSEELQALLQSCDDARFSGRPIDPAVVRRDLARARAWLEAGGGS